MAFPEAGISLILRALKFSAEKHSNQRRKDKAASPYINHPINVLETLWRVGNVRDAAVLAAAVLHDTIEDTETTATELEAAFGEEVAGLVMEVTDNKSLPKEVRKQLQIDHAPDKSPGAKQIKLADKLCNVHDISSSPPAHWPLQRREEYLDWTEKVVSGLRGANKELEDLYDDLLKNARARLAEEKAQQQS
jgi:guanosine-3',5'-bis(diphosphate) 3'-pyrophosphohydrolase